MNSLQLTIICHQRGLLSKEAMVEVLRTREQLINQALRKEAASIFSRMGRAINPANPKGAVGGFFGKFKQGRLTGKSGKAPVGGSGWSDALSNIGKLTALAGMTAGAGAGIHAVARHSKDKKLRGMVQQSYDQMFTGDPDLAQLREQHPDKVRQSFGILAQYAPSLAANPVVAGTFVKTQARAGHIGAHDMVRQLAETQAMIDKHHESISPLKGKWQEGMGLATKAIGP
jgi:hypothetical protein